MTHDEYLARFERYFELTQRRERLVARAAEIKGDIDEQGLSALEDEIETNRVDRAILMARILGLDGQREVGRSETRAETLALPVHSGMVLMKEQATPLPLPEASQTIPLYRAEARGWDRPQVRQPTTPSRDHTDQTKKPFLGRLQGFLQALAITRQIQA